ncbi:MAG TPA: hypothetical protein PLV06_05160 [Bacteroidales bacterium]|nr:hypothetical protein [Bacteroidales bacterium]HPI68795.1 hypothetical protein [Bacteroidales bacterium]HPR11752.1 hypothetical protein [Bacteroidales bacterium]HRW84100.1 hypothetical protein [Bacteroidales bacterium]
MKITIFKLLFLVIIITVTDTARAQDLKQETGPGFFGGAVSATSNGISFIPYISLGRPAVIFDMRVGKNNLSFEPQFRFAANGKPWAFVFWWRYKLLNTDKFRIDLAGHPSVVFKTTSVPDNGGFKDVLVSTQYLAGEIFPNYNFSKNVGAGIYYFYSRGLGSDMTRNTNMLALKLNFNNIRLSEMYYLRFFPQIYYLRLDNNDGFYVSETVSLLRKNFPLSVSSLINKSLSTEIPAESDFIWNVTLTYTFNKEYIEK